MRVIIVKPNEYAFESEIGTDLKSLQDIVGGTIEIVRPWRENVVLVCHDEGKLLNLPQNRALEDYDILAGTFFICGTSEEDLCSLTDEQSARYLEKFRLPETFISTPYGVIVERYDPDKKQTPAPKQRKEFTR